MLVDKISVSLARSNQRVLALEAVRVLMVRRREDAAVRYDEWSKHSLMVCLHAAIFAYKLEHRSIVGDGDEECFNIIPKSGHLLG